jgi:hypothetical protein
MCVKQWFFWGEKLPKGNNIKRKKEILCCKFPFLYKKLLNFKEFFLFLRKNVATLISIGYNFDSSLQKCHQLMWNLLWEILWLCQKVEKRRKTSDNVCTLWLKPWINVRCQTNTIVNGWFTKSY